MKLTSSPLSAVKNKTGGWRTFIPKTDYEQCVGCGTCAKICPEACIAMVKKGAKLAPKTDYDYCKGCGLCAKECPVKCIKMELDEK